MHLLTVFAVSLASLVPVHAAKLTQVTSGWENPTKLGFYIYVPDKLATKPPIIVVVNTHALNTDVALRSPNYSLIPVEGVRKTHLAAWQAGSRGKQTSSASSSSFRKHQIPVGTALLRSL